MNPRTKKLNHCFDALPLAEQNTLVEFAEFLYQRCGIDEKPLSEPQLEAAAENETVVTAIKRLSRSYPMLDKSKVLHEASGLMSQHLLQGRAASDVISELEQLFADHYQKLVENR